MEIVSSTIPKAVDVKKELGSLKMLVVSLLLGELEPLREI